MIKQLSYSADVLHMRKFKMIFRYIKKFITLFGIKFGYDKKLGVKLLLPGMDCGWNNNGSFKYKNRSGENYS